MGSAPGSAAEYRAGEFRVAVAAARYNEPVVAGLLDGARAAWRRHGGLEQALRIERVPGAFELPLAALQLARRGDIDAVVALGCVIRGETAHFELVAGECARGLQRVMLDTGVPIGFGVLAVDTLEQARARAAADANNKGSEALETALAMASLLRRLK